MGLLGDIGRSGGLVSPMVDEAVGMKRQFEQDAMDRQKYEVQMEKAKREKAIYDRTMKVFNSDININSLPAMAYFTEEGRQTLVKALHNMGVSDETGNGKVYDLMTGMTKLLGIDKELGVFLKNDTTRKFTQEFNRLHDLRMKTTDPKKLKQIDDQLKGLRQKFSFINGHIDKYLKSFEQGKPQIFIGKDRNSFWASPGEDIPEGAVPAAQYGKVYGDKGQTYDNPYEQVMWKVLNQGWDTLNNREIYILKSKDPLFKEAYKLAIQQGVSYLSDPDTADSEKYNRLNAEAMKIYRKSIKAPAGFGMDVPDLSIDFSDAEK